MSARERGDSGRCHRPTFTPLGEGRRGESGHLGRACSAALRTSWLILSSTLQGKCYDPHFREQETEAQRRGGSQPRALVTSSAVHPSLPHCSDQALRSGRAGIKPRFWLQSPYVSTFTEQSHIALEEASTRLNCYLFIFMNREFIHMVQNSRGTKEYTVKTPSHPCLQPPSFPSWSQIPFLVSLVSFLKYSGCI